MKHYKKKLREHVAKAINARPEKQSDLAKILRCTQSEISSFKREEGSLSVERLCRYLTILGHSINIHIDDEIIEVTI